MRGAGPGIAAPPTGSPRPLARRSEPPAERWRRRVHSTACPETDAAFRAGQLSPTQAAEITSAAGADPAAESSLLETAAGTGVKGLRDRCREVRAGAEADDAAWARRLHVERRAHSWTDPDGVYRLEARLAPDAGARFDAVVEGAHRPDLPGRPPRRSARAACGLCSRRARSRWPAKDRASPLRSARGGRRCRAARGHAEPGERCEIVGIGPVPVTTARALLDDAAVTVMTRDGDDITAVSRPTRTIPTKLRRALETRYPACGVPGCANDQFLEIDHIVPIEDHGATEIENLWRLCSHHHALKTYQGWKVVGVNGDRDLVPP